MTVQNNEAQEVEVFMSNAKGKSLEKALKRFDVKVFLDWSDSEADEIFYVELTSKVTNKRVTFTKSFFESPRNANKVQSKLNQIGNIDSSTYTALIYHIHDLIDNEKFVVGGGYSQNSTQRLEWDQQVAMKNAKLVVRNFLRNQFRFALQSEMNYASSKHLGVVLDKEADLPEGVIAVGFKGSALQAVLNPLGRMQSQQYRREILGGLAHLGVLDAEIAEYDDDEAEEVYGGSVVIGGKTYTEDGFVIENGKVRKMNDEEVAEYSQKTKKKKSHRLDKQRSVTEDKVGVKFYIMHFTQELLEEMKQYVAA
ncbi:hypothetical protein [Cohnella sp. AR92]|uniref:hypothetical protein n=1 Tax=Cohnella sp. AR92 TaxID=648716 RepID=UPI000F8F0A06|nr:hypothetical protein [Cohnella sp. AR92]RUS44619.1 hypothetical protein ELR57_22820 [Cohnella sp. AR92]